MCTRVLSRGITSTGNDVKLTVQAGGLSIGASLATGAGDLTLNVVGPVTQTLSGIITGTGLQLLGSGTVNLDVANNNVATIAASYSGPISYQIRKAPGRGTVKNTGVAPSLNK